MLLWRTPIWQAADKQLVYLFQKPMLHKFPRRAPSILELTFTLCRTWTGHAQSELMSVDVRRIAGPGVTEYKVLEYESTCQETMTALWGQVPPFRTARC